MAIEKILIIACGALAHEILTMIEINGFNHMELKCLPAKLHNKPDKIPDALRNKITENKHLYQNIFVAYADCGTGGLIKKICDDENIKMIEAPHCYSFYAGQENFDEIAAEEIGSFYLTDYLVRNFDTLIMEGCGLNKYPEMRDLMFSNYKRLVYLAQIDNAELDKEAEAAANKLQLDYIKITTGYGELANFIENMDG